MPKLGRGVVAVAVAVVVSLAPAHAADPSWSIVTSPNASATQHNFINDVTCVSALDCWAVGYYRADTAYQAVMEHWDGSSWSIVPSPDTSAAQDDFVHSVACASSSDCWAVGFSWSRTASAYQPLILRWDGTAWSVVASPNDTVATNGFLFDVTCVAASRCWAVGRHQIGLLGGGFGPSRTLIKGWDGSSWTTVTSPNTSPAHGNTLAAVSCTSASDCWTVGYHSNGTANQTLTARWDGSSWEIIASPSTSVVEHNFLNGVTCLSVSDCWAVGVIDGGVNQSLILRWDGDSWMLVPSPNTDPGLANVLFGVACQSASRCWAVGYHKAGNPLQTLMQSWDGSTWSLASSPNSSPGQTNTLRAVTCVSASECWTVGNYYNAQSISRTLTARYREQQTQQVGTEIALRLEQIRGDVVAAAELRSSQGVALEGKEIVFAINGQEWARVVTDEHGTAVTSFHRNEIKKADVVEARFLGDEGFLPSQASAQMRQP